MLAIGAALSGMFVGDVEGLEAGLSDSAAELSDASDFAVGESDGLAFVFFESECLEDDFRWLFSVGLGLSLASSVKVFFTLLLNRFSER
ncbi:MAG: hypothetical protein JO251_21300 [Verrucomicrobia bacterium]|nr:hypothetical protein [Verrucomicrobiota bacterium]MBV8641225.1 hypothetical protein [Verrucomicrobiota bacterium]